MCSTRKKGYEFKHMAEAWAKLYEFKYGHPSRAYPCPECKEWHLTTRMRLRSGNPNKKSKGARRRASARRRTKRKTYTNIDMWENEGGALRGYESSGCGQDLDNRLSDCQGYLHE